MKKDTERASFAPDMTRWKAKGKRHMGPTVYTAPPDGGWGWVVAVSFFVVEVFTYGFVKSFGIFLQDLMQEFGESNSRVSWIVSICVFVMCFTAPLASLLTSRFGFRPVVMAGGLFFSIGTITSGFTNSINQMYITFGLIGGLGFCMTFLPTVTILSQYFGQRRYVVISVASTGECFSIIILAPAFAALRDHIGWRSTLVVIGALQSIMVICGVLLRPIIIRPGPATLTETQGPLDKELEVLNPKDSSKSREGVYTEDISDTKDGSCTQQSSCSEDKVLIHCYSLSSREFENIELRPLHHQVPEDCRKLPEETPLQGKQDKRTKEGREKEDSSSKWSLGSTEKMENDETHEDHTQTASTQTTKLIDLSLLGECSFICYSLFGLFATLGFFAPQLFVIELSVSRGVERSRAAYMLSVIAVAEIIGRIAVGWVLSREMFRGRRLLVLLGFTVLMGLVLVAFTLVWEFWGLAVCCGCYGLLLGTVASTHIPLLAEEDVAGTERMVSATGIYVFIQSFAGLAGPPLAGVLVDLTHNYGTGFYSCAVGMCLGAVFLGLVRPAKAGLLCCSRRGPQNSTEPLQLGLGNPIPQ